jgi:hypothetical protein
MLQNGGDPKEAIAHFHTAESTGKALPFVRTWELGALIYNNRPGMRAELFRIANAMRKNGEPLEDGEKSRILSTCCAPVVTSQTELTEALSAVPPDQAWTTYLWLDNVSSDDSGPHLDRDFIQATILEISGDKAGALAKYKMLQIKVPSQSFTLSERVNDAIKRLSQK